MEVQPGAANPNPDPIPIPNPVALTLALTLTPALALALTLTLPRFTADLPAGRVQSGRRQIAISHGELGLVRLAGLE